MDNITRIIAKMLINEYKEFHTKCGINFAGDDCCRCVSYNECQHKQMQADAADKLWSILYDEGDY